LSLGDSHSCARHHDGTVWCWGKNTNGQLGNNTLVDSPMPVQVQTSSGPLRNVTMISAGDNHTCAVTSDGHGWCWGQNSFGQLGDGSMSQNPIAVTVQGLSGCNKVAAGAEHTCALKSDQTVWCWGHNGQAQLGNGTFNADQIATTPSQVL